ncbi:hypothetical protein [Pantoea ananatis]|jgi:hypothetical protein|uniref:hypothetical protein n=1 Tax=Pantoea ananas TaxID=553 RepID=UPI0002FD8B47|nr:hypothetical protein [Pantoea ananatis]AVG78734.1 hypothetical protein B9Q16_22260 [Pantoea ananatis]MDQ1224141.1 hypothetical protein [Pantoea ananatis]MDR6091548.1 hypothetical protein [Pantoea ananatis]PWV63690.1 hypothetical protein C7425_107145 [Pantoea ananatis]HCN02581.1 hypothetical protein [Pantoea ananatis]
MLLKGMNDPLLKAYQHPKSRLMISRFRGLAGDRRLSDWQVFCILVNGFTNYWYVLSGNFNIHVEYTKTRQFDFMQDFLHFSVTLNGLLSDAHFRCPDFILPHYDVPYEFCRWRSKRGYDSPVTYVGNHGVKSHKGLFIASHDATRDEYLMKWEGTVTVFDKAFFKMGSFQTTCDFLVNDMTKTIREGVIKHLSLYRDLYNYIFPSPVEARIQARDNKRYLAKK